MKTIPYVRIEEHPKYLRFDIEGVTTPTAEVGFENWSAIAEECRRHDCKKALVVEVLKESPETFEVFKMTEKFPSLLRGLKIAYVLVGHEHYPMITFGETVAVNRGAYVRVFEVEKEAEQGLMSS